jgi:hypothetical protein
MRANSERRNSQVPKQKAIFASGFGRSFSTAGGDHPSSTAPGGALDRGQLLVSECGMTLCSALPCAPASGTVCRAACTGLLDRAVHRQICQGRAAGMQIWGSPGEPATEGGGDTRAWTCRMEAEKSGSADVLPGLQIRPRPLPVARMRSLARAAAALASLASLVLLTAGGVDARTHHRPHAAPLPHARPAPADRKFVSPGQSSSRSCLCLTSERATLSPARETVGVARELARR